MSVTKFATGTGKGTALCALADQTVVVADDSGKLTRYDQTGTVVDSASIGAVVRGLAARPGGAAVLATSPDAGLWEVDFAGGTTHQLRRLPGARGLALDPVTGTALVCRKKAGGALVRVPVGRGMRHDVGTGLGPAIRPVARPGETRGWVLLGGAAASLVEVSLFPGDPAGAPTGTTITGLGRGRDVTWTGVAGTELAVADIDGRILLVDTASPGAAPVLLEDGLPRVWGLDLLPPSGPGSPPQLVAGIGDALALVDLPPPPDVVLEMPTAPVYLSSWARIGVSTTGGRTLDDLVFAIDPPHGGTISVSRDATFDHRPSVVLATSAVPGSYLVIALDRMTGDKVAVGKYAIADVYAGPDGPPVSFVGEVGSDSPDPAWGGGDPFVPQNLNVTPALGRKEVAVVIVETNDVTALSAADQATLRTAWQNEVFDGVMRGGVLESASRYWADVSDNQVDLVNAGVIGPIRLPNNWASYGTDVNTMTGKTDGWENFANAVVANIRQQNEAAASAGDPPVLDLTTVWSIILVLRSVPAAGTNPGRYIWPSATRPGGYQLSFEVARQTVTIPFPWGSIDVTVPITRTIQMLAMPTDWETRDSSGRVRGETAAHELGHNLGLPDEYARSAHPQWAKDRDLASTSAGASWSLMSWEEQFPQTTVVEKMRLGWVQAAHVRNLSFATVGPVDEDVVLHASDLGPPPGGRFSAIEVRIADGTNYYFEYRRELPTTTSDQDLPATNTVFGVDCRSGTEPSDRRNILRIKNDSDNDRAEFQAGDDYREQDTSDPSYPNDFEMEVLSTGVDSARVHIKYGDSKPDPQIRPWAPSTNWKSPDLQVTNARNQADSRFRDIPWEGHDNRIVATVRNPGQLDAHGVQVSFFVKDYTLGGGAETPLGSEVHDVPKGATVTFTSTVPWVPPPLSAIPLIHIAPHYCVVARIAEYFDPANPSIREITRDNNEAQSNHTQLISVSASPSSREIGFVKVTNPLAHPADCRVQVRQTSVFARTYVEHAWVRLQPGEERNVMFLTESLLGDHVLGGMAGERREAIYKRPNSVRLTGIVDDHRTCEGYVSGGAHVLVRAARATRFVKFFREGGLAGGRIEAADDGSGADGPVLVSVWPREAPEKGFVRETRAVNGGFEVELGDVEDGWVVQGHYLGSFDLGPCDSEVLDR